jgi:hypothetical protein
MKPWTYPLAVLAALALTSCANPPEVARVAAPSFAQSTPFSLDVADVQIVEEYQSPLRAPNAEQLFPTTPAEAMKSWVHDRIRAAGTDGQLSVIIKNAAVIETTLPKTQGLKGTFTNDQEARYDATLTVEMRVYKRGGAMSDASLSVTATRSQTVPEKASAYERDRIFNQILTDLMTSINAELEKNIQQYFGAVLVYGQ